MAIAKLRITWLLSWDAESIWRSASIHFPTLMLSVDSSIATETVVAACTSPPAGGKGFSTFRWGGTSKAYRRRVWAAVEGGIGSAEYGWYWKRHANVLNFEARCCKFPCQRPKSIFERLVPSAASIRIDG